MQNSDLPIRVTPGVDWERWELPAADGDEAVLVSAVIGVFAGASALLTLLGILFADVTGAHVLFTVSGGLWSLTMGAVALSMPLLIVLRALSVSPPPALLLSPRGVEVQGTTIPWHRLEVHAMADSLLLLDGRRQLVVRSSLEWWQAVACADELNRLATAYQGQAPERMAEQLRAMRTSSKTAA